MINNERFNKLKKLDRIEFLQKKNLIEIGYSQQIMFGLLFIISSIILINTLQLTSIMYFITGIIWLGVWSIRYTIKLRNLVNDYFEVEININPKKRKK